MVENLPKSKDAIITWPMLVDYSKIDCQRILRRLELEAYGKIVTVFRAQGPLTGEKRKTLKDLQKLLSIATDRHQAEVRRALNDEELATICESICGKETDDDWILEGKRIAPLLDRGIPQTAFLPRANLISTKWAGINHKLPRPEQTASDPVDNIPVSPKAVNSVTAPSNGLSITNPSEEKSNFSSRVKDDVITAVPEAALEVTCEADAPKSVRDVELYPQNELASDLPRNNAVSIQVHDEVSDISRSYPLCTESVTESKHEKTFAVGEDYSSSIESVHLSNKSELTQHPSKDGSNNIIRVNTLLSPTDRNRVDSTVAQFTEEVVSQCSGNLLTVDTEQSLSTHLNNGLATFVSQPRGTQLRPNLLVSSGAQPVNALACLSSQGLQFASLTTGPHASVTASDTRGVTTIALSGTTSTSQIYVPHTISTASPARIVKAHPLHAQQQQQLINYTTVSATQFSHLSASSILSDHKKQPMSQSGSVAASGNVIVVHRGTSGRLMATGSTTATSGVSASVGFGYNTSVSATTTVAPSSNAGRPLRILSMPVSMISASPTTYTPSLVRHPAIPVTHRNQPTILHSESAVTFEKSPILDLGTNSNVNILVSGGIVRSQTSAGTSAPTVSFLPQSTLSVMRPSAIGSGASSHVPMDTISASAISCPPVPLVNVLEPKRPRMAFIPSSRQL